MRRIEEEKQEPMAAEPLPLGKNWWLSFYSRPTDHPAFDYIHVEISLGEFTKEITKIHVPKIDGLVCESHSIIGHLINQNTENLLSEVERLTDELECMALNTQGTQEILEAKVKRLEGKIALMEASKEAEMISNTKDIYSGEKIVQLNNELEAKLKRQDEMIEACENGLKDICIRCKGVNGRQPVYESAKETLTKLKKLREQDSE